MRNRMEAGGADCPSVSSGLAVPGESEIGGFLRGSTTVCGGCSLRAVLIFFFGGLGGRLCDFLRRNHKRRLRRGTGQPYAFVRDVRGIEPTGKAGFQVIDRSAPPETEARGKGDRNERNPSTGTH